MPETPPYSSTTTAICKPSSRSWTISGPIGTVSGTVGASVMREEEMTGTSARRSTGTATARRRETRPRMSSESSPITGKREWPVSRARSRTSWALSPSPRV